MKKSLKSTKQWQDAFAQVSLSAKDQSKIQGGDNDYTTNAVNPFEWVHAKFSFR